MADEVMVPYNSRSRPVERDATRGPIPPVSEAGFYRDGEGIPTGTRYNTTLREWANKSPSATENAGPDAPSANPGMLPPVTRMDRRTGRIGPGNG